LKGVAACNARLFEQLDVALLYCVRPYYKPYRVGRQVYRGANAGDFAGINEIDLMLGLCRASDPYYAQLLHEKLPYMLPAEQLLLRESMSRRSILDQLLDHVDTHRDAPWFVANVRAFLGVCDAFGARPSITISSSAGLWPPRAGACAGAVAGDHRQRAAAGGLAALAGGPARSAHGRGPR
jgi:hypothetical protein